MAAGMVSNTPFSVHQADLLALAHKRHRLALHHRNTNLVGQQPHHRGPFHPRNRLQLLAPFAEGNEEDVATDIFAEYGKQFRAADLGQPAGLNVAGSGNAEARVATQDKS